MEIAGVIATTAVAMMTDAIADVAVDRDLDHGHVTGTAVATDHDPERDRVDQRASPEKVAGENINSICTEAC